MTSDPEDDETKAAPAEPGLPSVIVDAGLLREARSRESDPAVAQTPASAATDATRTDAAQAGLTAGQQDEPLEDSPLHAEPLSAFEADRFAASIRPSWDPPAPVGAAVRFSSAPPAAMPEPALASIEDEALPTTVFPPRVNKPTALFIAAGCIAGFGALLVYAIAGGETKRPESWGTNVPAPVAHETPEPVAAAPAPAPAAAPAPAPAPVEAAPTTPPPAPPPEAAPPAPAAAALPPAPVAAEPVRVAPAPPAPPSAPAVAKVRIRASTTPRAAQLRLDGARVSNPYNATVAQSGSHTFEARASGFQTKTRTVTFDRNQVVQLELDSVPSAPRTTSRPTAPAVSKKHIKTAPTPARPPAAPAAPRKGAGFVADSPY